MAFDSFALTLPSYIDEERKKRVGKGEKEGENKETVKEIIRNQIRKKIRD